MINIAFREMAKEFEKQPTTIEEMLDMKKNDPEAWKDWVERL